jgi:hypothetical protein
MQVPTDPGALHVSHARPQMTLQQTPSLQLPEPHCAADWHGVPLACPVEQTPPLQL